MRSPSTLKARQTSSGRENSFSKVHQVIQRICLLHSDLLFLRKGKCYVGALPPHAHQKSAISSERQLPITSTDRLWRGGNSSPKPNVTCLQNHHPESAETSLGFGNAVLDSSSWRKLRELAAIARLQDLDPREQKWSPLNVPGTLRQLVGPCILLLHDAASAVLYPLPHKRIFLAYFSSSCSPRYDFATRSPMFYLSKQEER